MGVYFFADLTNAYTPSFGLMGHESLIMQQSARRRAPPRPALHRDAKFLILSLEPGAIGVQLDRSAARAGMALGADAYVIMLAFDPVEGEDLCRQLVIMCQAYVRAIHT